MTIRYIMENLGPYHGTWFLPMSRKGNPDIKATLRMQLRKRSEKFGLLRIIGFRGKFLKSSSTNRAIDHLSAYSIDSRQKSKGYGSDLEPSPSADGRVSAHFGYNLHSSGHVEFPPVRTKYPFPFKYHADLSSLATVQVPIAKVLLDNVSDFAMVLLLEQREVNGGGIFAHDAGLGFHLVPRSRDRARRCSPFRHIPLKKRGYKK